MAEQKLSNNPFLSSYTYKLSNFKQSVKLKYHDGVLSMEEKKEFIIITRNSVDILSYMLNVETEHKHVKDDLMVSMAEKCRESKAIIQSIIETIGDDESLLFEALSLHNELHQVLSKYQQLDLKDPSVVNNLVWIR